MPSKVITALLQSDIVDRTPADVVAANPAGTFINGASSVPSYLYQSLKTIWVGASASLSDYQRLVVPNLGTGKSSSEGSIVVVAQRLTSSVAMRKSIRSDQLGAEVCPMKILLYKPRATSLSINPIQDAELRIRYLLDNSIRGYTGRSGSLPQYYVSQSISIDPRFPFFCFWEDLGEPVLASESTLNLRADYVRVFAR